MEQVVSSLADALFAGICGQSSSRLALPAFKYKYESFSADRWNSNLRQEPLLDGEEWDAYTGGYDSPDSLLRLLVHARVFNEFPVIAIQPELHAIGNCDTGVIEKFQSLQMTLPLPDGDPLRPISIPITGWWGVKGNRLDGVCRKQELTDRYPGDSLVFDTDEGVSSAAWFPTIQVQLDETHGFRLDLSHLGGWRVQFRIESSGSRRLLHVEAGPGPTHFRLHPGENVRMPEIAVMIQDGMTAEEAGELRQEFLRYLRGRHLKEDLPDFPQQPVTLCMPGNLKDSVILEFLKRKRESGHPCELLSIEDGWHGSHSVAQEEYDPFNEGISPEDQGNFEVNRQIHPDRLEPLVRIARRAGLSVQLSLPLEMLFRESPVAQTHPEWVLRSKKVPGLCLLNFGRGDVCQYVRETVRKLLSEEGVDHLFLPLTVNPLLYWQEADGEERLGLTELLYCNGLRQLLLDLRQEFPSCQLELGAKRIDFFAAEHLVLWHGVSREEGRVPYEEYQVLSGSRHLLMDPEEKREEASASGRTKRPAARSASREPRSSRKNRL